MLYHCDLCGWKIYKIISSYFRTGLSSDLFYVRNGVVNTYAMNFDVPVQANNSQLEFSWNSLIRHPVSALILPNVFSCNDFKNYCNRRLCSEQLCIQSVNIFLPFYHPTWAAYFFIYFFNYVLLFTFFFLYNTGHTYALVK